MVAILGDDHHIKQQSMGQEDMGRNEVVQAGCEDPKWKSRHDAEKACDGTLSHGSVA